MKKRRIVLLIMTITSIILLSAFTLKSQDEMTVNNEHIDHMATESSDDIVPIIYDDTTTFESN